MSSEKQPQPPDDPEAIRAEIERTREELGDTVEALSHKADVKGRASDAVDERKQQVKAAAGQAKETLSQAGTRAQEQVAGVASSVKDTTTGAAASLRQRTTTGDAPPPPGPAYGTAPRVGRDRTRLIAGAAVAAMLATVVVWRRSR